VRVSFIKKKKKKKKKRGGGTWEKQKHQNKTQDSRTVYTTPHIAKPIIRNPYTGFIVIAAAPRPPYITTGKCPRSTLVIRPFEQTKGIAIMDAPPNGRAELHQLLSPTIAGRIPIPILWQEFLAGIFLAHLFDSERPTLLRVA
jgi:hypothetical protein